MRPALAPHLSCKICVFARNLSGFAVGPIGPIGPLGRRLMPLDSQLPKAWRAKPAMPLQAPRAGRAPYAHARPAPACQDTLKLGFLQLYPVVLVGTSQTCLGCRGDWKFGSLEA